MADERKSEGRRPLRLGLPRMLIESALVVGSILVALAVDEFNEGRDFSELADRSLMGFEREIQQNMARLADATPFHVGLRDVMMNMRAQGGSTSLETFRNMIDGFEPAILVSTAWETGVATGALSHIEYDVVAALSLTYGIQERLTELNSSGLTNLFSGRSGGDDMETLVYVANRYLRELTEEEQKLQLAYEQVLAVLNPAAPEANEGGASP